VDADDHHASAGSRVEDGLRTAKVLLFRKQVKLARKLGPDQTVGAGADAEIHFPLEVFLIQLVIGGERSLQDRKNPAEGLLGRG